MLKKKRTRVNEEGDWIRSQHIFITTVPKLLLLFVIFRRERQGRFTSVRILHKWCIFQCIKKIQLKFCIFFSKCLIHRQKDVWIQRGGEQHRSASCTYTLYTVNFLHCVHYTLCTLYTKPLKSMDIIQVLRRDECNIWFVRREGTSVAKSRGVLSSYKSCCPNSRQGSTRTLICW